MPPVETRFSRDPDSPSRRRALALARADERLHAELIQARREAGLSQSQVAEIMGVTQPTVAAFERYDNDPRLSTIRRYAHAVGVRVSHELRTDEGRLISCDWGPVEYKWKSVTYAATPRSAPVHVTDLVLISEAA